MFTSIPHRFNEENKKRTYLFPIGKNNHQNDDDGDDDYAMMHH